MQHNRVGIHDTGDETETPGWCRAPGAAADLVHARCPLLLASPVAPHRYDKCNTTNPNRSFLTRHILSSVRKSSAVCHWYKTPNQHTRIRSWLKPRTSWPSDHCGERTALVGGQPGTIKLIFHFNLLSLTSGQKEERGGKVVSHHYNHCYFLELCVFCVQSAGSRPLLHFSVFSCGFWGNG